jgi:hypothetical protein
MTVYGDMVILRLGRKRAPALLRILDGKPPHDGDDEMLDQLANTLRTNIATINQPKADHP